MRNPDSGRRRPAGLLSYWISTTINLTGRSTHTRINYLHITITHRILNDHYLLWRILSVCVAAYILQQQTPSVNPQYWLVLLPSGRRAGDSTWMGTKCVPLECMKSIRSSFLLILPRLVQTHLGIRVYVVLVYLLPLLSLNQAYRADPYPGNTGHALFNRQKKALRSHLQMRLTTCASGPRRRPGRYVEPRVAFCGGELVNEL